MAEYNGHPSWNAWNVSLWINNDEGLYQLARECVRQRGATRAVAARRFLETLEDMGCTHTPDGAPYTITSITRAMREL